MSRGSGFTGDVRFCPKCGVNRIERDTYRVDHKVGGIRPKDFFPEFLCNLCGFAFMVKPSMRWEKAMALFKRDRQLRPPNTKFNIGVTDE